MQITLAESVPVLLTLGKLFSAVAMFLVLAAIWNIWRRKSFPDVTYGGVSLSPKRIRWVWFLVLLGAFGFGVNEDPVTVSTRTMEDPEAEAAATAFRTVSLTLPLPFYRYARERVYGDGELVREQVLEGFILPWPLISALVAYLVLVLRWRTGSRWARRILQGRKWRAEGGTEAE